jgi:small subunit ribosomal protein S18
MGEVHIKTRRRRRKVCHFCVDKARVVDYKEVDKLRRYVTERGKIFPRRNSGTCAKHQRVLAQAIKRARFIGFLPYCVD